VPDNEPAFATNIDASGNLTSGVSKAIAVAE
jgi:hypothetical protein